MEEAGRRRVCLVMEELALAATVGVVNGGLPTGGGWTTVGLPGKVTGRGGSCLDRGRRSSTLVGGGSRIFSWVLVGFSEEDGK